MDIMNAQDDESKTLIFSTCIALGRGIGYVFKTFPPK